MNILAFDTCFDVCSVAAGRKLRSLSPLIATLFEPMQSGQAERLLPMIEEVLSLTGMNVGDLDLIAVTEGPGTFTGTRITTAAARALALFGKTPIVAMSTLKLMAMNYEANATGAAQLAIATDARRGEVYFEAFDPQTLASLSPPRALTIEDAAQLLPAGPTVLAGSGAASLAGMATSMGKTAIAVAPRLLPDALDMLFTSMEMPRVNAVHAVYLRPPDAKPQTNAALVGT